MLEYRDLEGNQIIVCDIKDVNVIVIGSLVTPNQKSMIVIKGGVTSNLSFNEANRIVALIKEHHAIQEEGQKGLGPATGGSGWIPLAERQDLVKQGSGSEGQAQSNRIRQAQVDAPYLIPDKRNQT